MINHPKYYIVEASALPEVFLKVSEAKRLLATGEACTVNEAAKKTGISRSAFYKYRDSVQSFRSMNANRIITFQCLLRDVPGALSAMLSAFAGYKVNVLSVNSVNPSNGCGTVTIIAETYQATVSLDDMLNALHQCSGVVKVEILSAG